jgi:hypothetical protein
MRGANYIGRVTESNADFHNQQKEENQEEDFKILRWIIRQIRRDMKMHRLTASPLPGAALHSA